MLVQFSPPANIEGLTFLSTRTVHFIDQCVGRQFVFAIYSFSKGKTGELVQVMVPKCEPIVDKLNAMGLLESNGVQR